MLRSVSSEKCSKRLRDVGKCAMCQPSGLIFPRPGINTRLKPNDVSASIRDVKKAWNFANMPLHSAGVSCTS